LATLMQMWNMVIGGGGTYRGLGGTNSAQEATGPTHGMPAGMWVPGMRGHIGLASQPGLETGIGPSYGPGAPYTATNTQSIIEAITKGEWAQEAAEAATTGPIDIQAPAGKPPSSSVVQDQSSNGPSTPPVVKVGQGQSKKSVRPMPMPGSNASQGEKQPAAVIAEMMTIANPPAKSMYEAYTQMALQSDPPATNPQANRANNSNSNKVNGRTTNSQAARGNFRNQGQGAANPQASRGGTRSQPYGGRN